MNSREISKLTFILVFIAFGIFAVIIVLFINQNLNEKTYDFDTQQKIFAEHQAEIEYQKSFKSFSAVFDTETKTFVDEKTAKRKVKPYGTSKEHSGMYLLVDVDEKGNISSKWISP